MKCSLEACRKILSTLVDVFVDDSLSIVVIPSVLVWHRSMTCFILIGSSRPRGQLLQTVTQLNISDILLNLLMSI